MSVIYRKVNVDQLEAYICDCCKTKITDLMQMQEMMNWGIIGGYDSIFGDGRKIEIDLCQHCIKKLLGNYLRVEKSNLDLLAEDELQKEFVVVDSNLIGNIGNCKECGYPVADYLCNNSVVEKRPEATNYDYWMSCTNKNCKYHYGEGYLMEDPTWIERTANQLKDNQDEN